MVSMSFLEFSSKSSSKPLAKTFPSSSSLDKDSRPPEPSVFQRLCSSLILFSFLFQTLWPSLAFSMDGPVDVLRPGLPHSIFKGGAFDETPGEETRGLRDRGKTVRHLGVEVDTVEKDFDSTGTKPIALVPMGRSLVETQKWIDASLSLQALYPGLKALENGLTWSSLGYSFFLHDSGTLLVSAHPDEDRRSPVLRLYNPQGAVILSENLAMDHLFVKATHVIQGGENSITQVDVWAMGDSKASGTFINTKEAALGVTQLRLHQRTFLNQGSVSVAQDGVLDLKGQDLQNAGHLELGDRVQIRSVQTLTNTESGIIHGRNAFVNVRSFYNHHLVHLENDLHLTVSRLFQNEKTGVTLIGGRAIVSGAGSLVIEEGTTDKAGMAIDGHLIFDRFQGAVTNKGSLVVRQSIQETLSKLFNHKNLSTGDLSALFIEEFWNTGTVQGNGTLSVRRAKNQGLLQGDHLTLNTEDLFENQAGGLLKGSERLTLLGKGRFVNQKRARFESPQTCIDIQTFENHPDLDLEEGALIVSEEVKQFINHEEALLKAKEMILQQRGVFTNEGTLSSRRLDNKGYRFINKGSVAVTVLNHTGHTLDNQAGAEFDVTRLEAFSGEELRNEGEFTVKESQRAGAFTVKKIINKAQMNLHVLGIFKGESLFNTGTLKLRGHDLELHFGHLDTSTNLQFLNTGTTQITLTNWQNSGTAFFSSATIFRVHRLLNKGIIHGKGNVSGRIETYEGAKDSVLQGESDLSLKGHTLLLEGKILSGKDLAYAASSSFEVLKTGEMVATKGHLTLSSSDSSIENHGALSGTNGVSVLDHLDNHGIIKGGGYQGVFLGRVYNGPKGFIEMSWVDQLSAVDNKGYLEIGTLVSDKGPISLLKNTGQILLKRGKLAARIFRNKGTFSLKQGRAVIGTWDNEDGTAELDELSVTSSALELKGELTAKTFLAKEYASVINEGHTTFASGGFKAYRTTNSGFFSIKKGFYEVGYLYNTGSGILSLLQKSHVKTNGYLNDGLIESPTGMIWKVSKIPTKSGKIKTKNDLIVQIDPSLNAPQFLGAYANQWDVGRTLRVEADSFHNTKPLTFAVPVSFKTKSFQNISKIIAPTWRLETESFTQGRDNSLYGEIKAEGPLSIVSQRSVDNRYGKIQGKETVLVRSLKGDVITGSYVESAKRKDSFIPFPTCSDGKPLKFDTEESLPFYHSNESFIASNKDLEIEGQNVSIDFGGLLSMGTMHLKAVNQIRILSAKLLVGKNLTITGGHYLQTRWLPEGTNHYNAFRGQAFCWDEYFYHKSEASLAQVLGNVYFQVSRVTLDSSHLWANGNIFDRRAPGIANPLHLFEMIAHTRPFKRTITAGPCSGNWWSNLGYSLEIPTIRAGQTIALGSGRFVITGNVSSRNLFLSGQSLETTNVRSGRSSVPSYTQPQLYDLAKIGHEETQNSPFFKETRHGVMMMTTDPGACQDAYDRHKITVLGGLSIPPSAQFYLHRDAFDFILNKTLGLFAKNLNIQGVSGPALVQKLHQNAEAEAKRRGKKYLVKKDLETAAASMIVYELLEVNQQMQLMTRLLVTPSDMNRDGDRSGAMTATEDLKTHMTDFDLSRSSLRKAGRDLTVECDGFLGAETLKDRCSSSQGDQKEEWDVARQRAEFIAGRGLQVLGGDVEFTGVHVEGKTAQVKGKHSVVDRPFTLHTSKKDSSSVEESVTSHGSTYKAETKVDVECEDGSINLTAVNVEAPKTTLKAPKGNVFLFAGVHQSVSAKVQKKANGYWQKITQEMEHHQTYVPCQFTGDLEIEALEKTIEGVQGQTLEWIERLKQKGDQSIHYILREEIHKKESKTLAQGPTAALCAVIALAATLATSGAGTALGGTVAGSAGLTTSVTVAGMTTTTLTGAGAVVSTMTAAAFTSLSAGAAVALARHNGNIGKAARSLSNSETLKSAALNAVTAGVIKGLGATLGVATTPAEAQSFVDHLKKEALRTGVGMGIGAATGEKIDLDQAARSVAAGTLGGFLANRIGDLYGKALIDPATHKILHAAVGAMTGGIISEDMARGASSGAMGAFIAETFADAFAPDKPMEKIKAKEIELGRRLTPAEFGDFYQEELESYGKKVDRVGDFGKIAAATAALLAEQDVGMATFTATTAVENNFLILAQVGITAACIAYEAYYLNSIYEDQGAIAALTALGIDVAAIYAGGVIVKAATPALRAAVTAALDKMPGLRFALGALAERLILATESLAGTKIGQGIAKVEAGIQKGYDKATEVFGKGGDLPSAKGVGLAKEAATEPVPGLSFQGGRYAEGMAHISEPLVDAAKLLRGTHNNAGNVPIEVAKALEGKTFSSFDQFRGEFWKTVANSKYAGEFGALDIMKMQRGLAPDAPLTQRLGGRVSYEIHHQVPISKGGASLDLSNLIIATPRYHLEALEKGYHFKR